MGFPDHLRAQGWKWSGEILIPAAGVAGAPRLFDRKNELIREAGSQRLTGQIQPETTQVIAALVMPEEDWGQMATLNFEGGMLSRAKVVAITMKATRNLE